MRKDLDRFFDPKAIVIVGASSDFATISGQPLKHLVSHQYAGRLYPVNPKYPELMGVKAWPNVASLPEVPDLALIMVGAPRVSQALRDVGEKGVPYAIVFASGYSELGAEGRRLQAEIVEIAGRYGIGVIGPNCQGMISIVNNVFGGFGSVHGQTYVPGAVSMVSQSGGFGFTVMALAAQDGGLGHRHVVTTGNECGVSTLEFMDYYIADPGTRMITSYVEGLKDAHRLVEVGTRALAAEKPILVWKVGNSDEGQRAVASHTANLGGAMALYRAAFAQTGIIPIEDIADVVDLGHAFLCGMRPRGNRVAILTVSGGAGILMTDEAAAGGMQLAQLSAESTRRLRAVTPSFAALGNPIDVTAAIFDDTDLVRQAMEIIVEDPGVDSIAICNVSLQGDTGLKVAKEIVKVRQSTDKPVFVSWSARDPIGKPFYELLDAAKIPRYKSPMRCAKALATVTRYYAAVDRMKSRATDRPLELAGPGARALLAGRTADVAEYEAKRVLAEYGIGITEEALATTADEAVAHARRIGGPVALKVQSADISHKTEAGAVRLGVSGDAEVREAYDTVLRNARAYRADARIDGVLVQEMVEGGIEAIVGIDNDPLFGPAIMFGLGGIFAEVLKDVSFRLAPVTRPMAEDMIREIKGFKVLDGARGKPKADVAALADALVRLSALAVDLKDRVAELDVNPLFVFPEGRGVKAGDALIPAEIVTLALSAELESLRAEVRRFVEGEIEPRSRWIEENDAIPEDLVAKMRAMGLYGLNIPEAYGGIGLDLLGKCVIEEELGRSNSGVAHHIGNQTGISTNGIIALGTEPQKQKYLPRMASGEWIGSFALTEPQAGSNPAEMRTSAERRGDRYVLNGEKIYITNAGLAQVFTVMAITDRSRGVHGISAFIVERGFPGLRVGRNELKMGMHGCTTAPVYLEDCEVPVENLLGREGQGYVQALKTLTQGRVTVSFRALGMMSRLIERSVEYLTLRTQGGRPLAEYQGLQWMLADMALARDASRLLSERALETLRAGARGTLEAAMAKLHTTEALAKVADCAVQIHGGMGYMREAGIETVLRDARIMRIYEGTSEIQRNIIAGHLLRGD